MKYTVHRNVSFKNNITTIVSLFLLSSWSGSGRITELPHPPNLLLLESGCGKIPSTGISYLTPSALSPTLG